MTQQEKREAFVEYQRQFYNENEYYDLVAQSDQSKAIIDGKYDKYIDETFEVKLTVKRKI